MKCSTISPLHSDFYWYGFYWQYLLSRKANSHLMRVIFLRSSYNCSKRCWIDYSRDRSIRYKTDTRGIQTVQGATLLPVTNNNMGTIITPNKKLFQTSTSIQSSAYLLRFETIPSVMMLPVTSHEKQELYNLFHVSHWITRNHVEKEGDYSRHMAVDLWGEFHICGCDL